MTVRKLVALFDTHVPYQIPLGGVFKFIKDFKPDTIVLGGDMHDWESVCHWVADQSRALDGGTITENYKELHDILLDPLQKVAPNANKVYLTGNHEVWLQMAASLCPNGRGYWELDRNIDFKKYNMRILPVNVPFQASKHLYLMHGMYVNKYHAEHTVSTFQRSVMYGHTHDVQEFTIVSPLDVKQSHKGKSCGCLCHRNPHYMKNKPNRWVNGFNYVYIDEKDGHFWENQVYIIDNEFIADGHFYKA